VFNSHLFLLLLSSIVDIFMCRFVSCMSTLLLMSNPLFFLKQRTVGEIPTVNFINNLSNSQDYKSFLTESI
jgi:hypothetical protein